MNSHTDRQKAPQCPTPTSPPSPNTSPVAARVPDPGRYFFHDPNLARLDDGALLIAAPEWGRRHTNLGRTLRIVRSTDGGRNLGPTCPPSPTRKAALSSSTASF